MFLLEKFLKWQRLVKFFSELHQVLKNYRDNSLWLFRGHSNLNWSLVPSWPSTL